MKQEQQNRIKLTPEQALRILQQGNLRFINEQRVNHNIRKDIKRTADKQQPMAIVLGCIDSRAPVETIFDTCIGDIFCIRVAGNIVNDDVLASMEYACDIVGAKLIVILGHTRCGAIGAACDNIEQGLITQLLQKIKPAIAASDYHTGDKSEQAIMNVTDYNVAQTINQVMVQSPTLSALLESRQCGIVGAIYDVTTGVVTFKDYSSQVAQLNPELADMALLY